MRIRDRGAGHAGIGAALTLGLALVLGLGACAPEPDGRSGPSTAENGRAGSSDLEAEGKADAENSGEGDGGTSWPEREPVGGAPKHTEVPPSFPATSFVIPPGAVIDDIGERSASAWYVVLRADDADDADARWQAVIGSSGLTVESSESTADGGLSAQLRSASLAVDALTLPQPDGSVLLSYDLERVG